MKTGYWEQVAQALTRTGKGESTGGTQTDDTWRSKTAGSASVRDRTVTRAK